MIEVAPVRTRASRLRVSSAVSLGALLVLCVLSLAIGTRTIPPTEVVTPSLVADVFDVGCQVVTDPVSGTPPVIPHRPAPPGHGQ